MSDSVYEVVDTDGNVCKMRQSGPTCRCPFCGGTYCVVRDVDDAGKPALMHSMPPCDTFDEMDIISFMEQARKNGAHLVD